MTPSEADLTAGQSQQFTLTAATYAVTSNSSLLVTGSTGYQISEATLNLQVTAYAGNPGLSRTRYVRTDASYPYMVLYDSANNRFFMSDSGSNQIFVLDGSTQELVGAITVPGAYGMDETPDHAVLYAGTQIGDVYAIDPAKMTITHRYVASQIGTKGFQAYAVQVMANGELALLGGQGGIPSVDGYSEFAFWNPVTNAIQIHGGGPVQSCADEKYIFTFTVTGDRSLLVLQNFAISGPSANEVCTIDPVTGQTNYVNITGSPVTPTPDGKSILVLEYGIQAQMVVFDAHTLAQTAMFAVGDFPAGTFAVVSPDSSTVYLAPDLGGIVYAFNISNGTQVGWIPDLYTQPIGTLITASDNTGLLAGVNVEGIGFLDAAAMQTGPVGTAYLGGYVAPNTGPVAGGTAVDTYFSNSANLATVYFGQNPATAIMPSSSLYATTPPGSPGPADVVSIMTDGSAVFMPAGFSYGPTILEATPNASTAEGGGTGMLYGYGFGPGPGYEIPQGLQVTVGGQPVALTAFNPQGYSYGTASTPLQSISFTIPAGAAGTVADISVTTPSGIATLHGGMQYLPAVQAIALSGAASLVQGIYDATRDVYYFTDTSEIRVYSRTLNQWLSPIQVPSAPAGATHQLWGIALSPGGTNLAVADISTGIIYELNPSSPASVNAFTVSSTPLGTVYPVGVAVSDAGMIYYTAWCPGVSGAHGFFKLDTSTGSITDYGVILPGVSSDIYLRDAISTDNSKVFFNDDGNVFSVTTNSDAVTWAIADPTCCYGDYDLTLSSGQSTLEATSYLYDTNLNAESYLGLSDQDISYISYVYGAKLSADGTLLFQPSTNGIDVYDGRLGTLRSRIALPFSFSQNFDALVHDGKDNILIAITGDTGSGIAIVDLSSVVEPGPLPYTRAPLGMNRLSSGRPVTSAASPMGAIRRPPSLPRLKVPHASRNLWPHTKGAASQH